MTYYLPTRDECKAITEATDSFFRIEKEVEGQKVEIYNYRLASLSDFIDNKAHELRGLTFVQEKDGSWTRNILMNKFFNIGETSGYQLQDVAHKKIVRVQNKEDGSIISFVKFANGKIRAKSKTSFISDQAVMAQKIFNENSALKNFVWDMINIGLTPIFELTSPENQIVLEYKETKLILLQIRRDNGTYILKSDGYIDGLGSDWERYIKRYKLDVAEDFDNLTLNELLELKETSDEKIEGWVITFEDGQMAKIKTNKYIQMHGFIGPDAFRENILIKTIIEGNIDDVIAALVEGKKKEDIIAMEKKVTDHYNHLVAEFKKLRGIYFAKFKGDRASFAKVYSKTPLFKFVIKTVGKTSAELDIEKEAKKAVYNYILKRTNGLNKAKDWLDSI